MFTNIQYRKNIKKSLLDCFKINGKQRIQMLKNLNALNSKTLKNKITIYDLCRFRKHFSTRK